MAEIDLTTRIDSLQPKNAVRILEAIRNEVFRGLSPAERASAERELGDFAEALDLGSNWQARSVTEAPGASASGDPSGEAAKAMLQELAKQPGLQLLVEQHLEIRDDSASLTLALGLPLVVTTAWLLASGRLRVRYSPERGWDFEFLKEGLPPKDQAKVVPGFIKSMMGLAQSAGLKREG